ncbi:MAG TPA: hypothetical protein VFD16_03760 [Candidatus Saccharimonadales bacterium]|nr:hypothetical protein [Candidatus Saccharimonadales bacterium]
MNNEKIGLDSLTADAETKSQSKNEGKTISWNEALEYNKNETTMPEAKTQTDLAQEAQSNTEFKNNQPEKTTDELKNDIAKYREQIKIGETKDAGGKYNEKLILENEAKLRGAEKMLNGKIEESNKQNLINEIRKEINSYQENIKIGETKDASGKYNEKLVLENEAKLREAENKVNELTNPTQKMSEQKADVNPVVAAPVKKNRSWLMQKLFGNE